MDHKKQDPPKLSTQAEELGNYDSIELSALEIETITAQAIHQAKKKKFYELKQKRYFDEINQAPIFQAHPASWYFARIKQHFKDEEGVEFELDEENRLVVEKLCKYFSQDPSFEDIESEYSFKKGLLLWGPVGCGKTRLMRALSLNQVQSFRVIPVRDVTHDFAEGGHGFLKYYSDQLDYQHPIAKKMWQQSSFGACFDDLGTEENKKRYGNEENVMATILLGRYDQIMENNFTHVTTNLSADNLEKFYGTRVRSRLRQMFNMISFPNDSKDRRK